jgi:uncharacterized protein DUF4328
MNPQGYESLAGRLKAVKIVFGALAAIAVVAVVSDALEIALLGRLISGADVSDAALDGNDRRQAIVGGVQQLVIFAAAGTFIAWLYRAYGNLDVASPGTRRYLQGWAIGGWFVPFMAFWRPKQVLNDVWQGGTGYRSSALTWFWWANFVVWGVTGTLYRLSARAAETPEAVRGASTTLLIYDLLCVSGALLALRVAVEATRCLDRAAAARSEAPAGRRFERAGALPETQRAEDGSFPPFPG